MPKRTDLHKILLIGSGPIVIGQACEFDYSGTQACKALREEGYEVVLVNSNPATIMTDPATADRTYIEPLTWEIVAKVIEKERPDALLPTLGGQTGLNVAMDLWRHGVLEKFGVEMIGANADVIDKAESRDRFQKAMQNIGLDLPRGRTVHNVAEARDWLGEIGLPAVLRPSFTMGGSGSAIAFEDSEFDRLVERAIEMSPVRQILIEESIIGWKEYEMVGSNIQFAIHPGTGRMIVIEMNPRVSRSSALASKATGFPIAKIAAKLAVGYRLHELPNDITRVTTACFEPTIDYVVTKVPRFAFEKFPGADATLTTQMKSVGETMAIGSTFKESFQKALRGLEVKSDGFGCDSLDLWGTPEQPSEEQIVAKLKKPGAERVWYLRYALKSGMSVAKVYELTGIDPWFLDNLKEIIETEELLRKSVAHGLGNAAGSGLLRSAKRQGFSDRQLSRIFGTSESDVRSERLRHGIRTTFKSVDTCAAEFEAYTPYYYSTYEDEDEVPAKQPGKKRIIILGGGPNRIGQGIEFDYCCCHASFALKELGIESVMVNSNPETVSTDYDTSDMLFFEPLTVEDVLNICDRVKPDGVIVQFGGQTPLNLARRLSDAGVPIIGTSVDAIEAAEDREKFQRLLHKLGLRQPPNGIARRLDEARRGAKKIGYPILVRPSFVLGGRAMEICYDATQLKQFVAEAFVVADGQPVLIDSFLEGATEVDVDCISDGRDVIVSGLMVHIEEAGIHSGDSACAIPPYSLPGPVIAEIRKAAVALAKELNVIGLMNVQYAVKSEGERFDVYVLEVNPRASRTVP